jgi:hypothetical protein
VFEIDVRNEAGREVFRLRYPSSDVVATEALEVKPKLRHLVLDVSGWRLPISGRYLCGHDERHWFLASLPVNRHTTTVRGAMEALKPDVVKRAQKRLRVRHRRYRRKTAAYIRQGEWFFLPRPMMQVDDRALPNGQLVREGGKPHQAEWIYRPEGLDATFVRGSVSHPDHETIRLEVWHRVVQNTEVRIVQDKEGRTRSRDQPSTRMAYLD